MNNFEIQYNLEEFQKLFRKISKRSAYAISLEIDSQGTCENPREI